jgi:hypothetical protein
MRKLLIILFLLSSFANAQQKITLTVGKPQTVDYTPVDFPGPVNHALVNLTVGETPAYRGWGRAFGFQTSIGLWYREGVDHLFSTDSKIIMRISSDGGYNYSRTEFHTEAGVDSRNFGGGNTANGRICLFWGRWSGGTSWLPPRCATSFNGTTSWTFSGDLPVYSSAVDNISPYGRTIENDASTLFKQSFYGSNSDASMWYVWTLESSDLLSWTSPKLIDSGALSECSILNLGSDKVIAAIRKDNSPSDKDIIIYNSSDFGEHWTRLGKAKIDAADVSGASPYLEKIDSTHAHLIGTWRGSVNNFSENTIAFGDSVNTGLVRFMLPGLPNMDANAIDFGYPAGMAFTTSDSNKLIAYYGTSPNWVSGTPHYTDIFVGPAYRKKLTVTSATSSPASGVDGVHSPSVIYSDEIPVYNNGASPNYQQCIRENANYDIRTELTFTGGNTSGTYRKVRVDLYDNTGSYVSTLHEVTQAASSNVFDFTYNTDLVNGDRIAVFYIQDSGSALTVTSKVTITKN